MKRSPATALRQLWLTPGRVPIRYRLLLGFAVPLAVWILVSIANVAVWNNASDNSENLIESQQIILLANEYISASLRAQAAKRGFLMTSDEQFLKPYREASAGVNRLHSELVDKVRNRPEQLDRLQRAGNLFQEWLYDVARERINERQSLSVDLIKEAHELEKLLLMLQDAHMRATDEEGIPRELLVQVRDSTHELLESRTLREYEPALQQALRYLERYEVNAGGTNDEAAVRALRDAIAMLTRSIEAVLTADFRIKASYSDNSRGGLIEEFHAEMQNFIETERSLLDQYRKAMTKADERARLILWLGPALGLLLMVLMTSWMSRRIAHSLEGISRAARGLARGDLRARAIVAGNDEFAVLAERFNTMATLVENRSRESAALAELGELLQSSTSINEAARIFGRLATRLFPRQPGVLYLLSPARDEAISVTTWSNAEAFTETEFSPEDCWALRLSRPHENGDATSVRCPHLVTESDRSLCLPLHAFGETLGMLFVADPAKSFSSGSVSAEQHREFTDTVAEQLALALANLRMRETLRHQSIRDPLTQLYNRRYLEESFRRELHRAARRNKPLSVLTFDIDHFKRFNDLHGHDGGDALLKAVGNCLRDFFREEDGAFRSGGEEFVAILPETTLEDAMARADELRRDISRLEVQHGNLLLPPVTISIGVATYPVHGDTPDQLLKSADRALYTAKESGRNRVCEGR